MRDKAQKSARPGEPERALGGSVEKLQQLDANAVCIAVAGSLRRLAGQRSAGIGSAPTSRGLGPAAVRSLAGGRLLNLLSWREFDLNRALRLAPATTVVLRRLWKRSWLAVWRLLDS